MAHIYKVEFLFISFFLFATNHFQQFFFLSIILKISENLMSMMDEENSLWMLVECLSEKNSQKWMRELETN